MFSDEGYEEVLEDSKDELVAKKSVFDSDKDDGGEREADAMGMCLLPLLDLFFFFGNFLVRFLIILCNNFLSHRYSQGA